MIDGQIADDVGRSSTQRGRKIAAAAIPVAAIVTIVLFRRPSAPSGLENGSFVNDCCGTLQLHDGDMILNDKPATRYTVGRDARGAYILPQTYVGGFDEIGFEIDGSRPATKLRLDRLPHPKSLIVPGGRNIYRFERELVSAR